jgi:hypothetical protein
MLEQLILAVWDEKTQIPGCGLRLSADGGRKTALLEKSIDLDDGAASGCRFFGQA